MLSARRNTPRLPIVALIGASDASQPVLEMAEKTGIAIRKQGWHLLTGGGAGVMEAACRGFQSVSPVAQEMTIGILPSDNTDFANRFVDIAIPTGMGWARNAIIARTAWGLIAVGGCSGTLSEIAFAWQMNKPIVALSNSGGWSSQLAGVSVDNRRDDVVFSARSGEDAVVILKQHFANDD